MIYQIQAPFQCQLNVVTMHYHLRPDPPDSKMQSPNGTYYWTINHSMLLQPIDSTFTLVLKTSSIILHGAINCNQKNPIPSDFTVRMPTAYNWTNKVENSLLSVPSLLKYRRT